MTPQPEIRIGDAEREAAVAALGEHYAAGRLTKEEYDERAAVAWTAKTNSALWPLFADLPRPQAAPRPTYATGRGPQRSHRGGWSTIGAAPLLLVLIAVAILTHFPVILLLGVAWLLWARSNGHYRRWDQRRDRHSWDHRWDRR